jgi:phosphoribosylamine---glycine ligase
MENILVLGSGGREDALCWKISQSPYCGSIFIAPGNAGTANHGTNVSLNINDFHTVGDFCNKNQISLIIPGSEEPLINGITDYFRETPELRHIRVFGPDKASAKLEGSKDFAKKFMIRHGIPTAGHKSFTAILLPEAKEYLRTLKAPYVLKADGLAAGKGVVICQTQEYAEKTLEQMLLDNMFGEASSTVVIEEFLSGIELSCFILTDGENYFMLPEAKDYKRIGEQDTGENTGGMGAVSPVPFASREFMDKVQNRIIIPTLTGLKAEGLKYSGFIFFGLMNCNGDPYLIEYNVRLGDPETEVILPRLKNDLLELILDALDGNPGSHIPDFLPQTCSTIFTVSGGYPGKYEKNKLINNLKDVQHCLIFHAGTIATDRQLYTNGGRVLAFSALGRNLHEALMFSSGGAETVQFEGKYYRKDIGFDLLNLSEQG